MNPADAPDIAGGAPRRCAAPTARQSPSLTPCAACRRAALTAGVPELEYDTPPHPREPCRRAPRQLTRP